jgi:cytochrome b561
MLTGVRPAMTSRPASYDNVSKFLHWSTALLLVAGFFIGENTSHRFADGIGYGFHVSIGIAILVLTGLRILWRLTNPAPRYPETMSGLEKTAASLIKLAFYAVLILLPLSGLVTHADEFPAGGQIFGLFELPALPGWLMLGEGEEVHEAAAHAWIPLTAIHAAAALWHHYYRRDDVLTRMTRG